MEEAFGVCKQTIALTKVWLWGNPIIALLWENDPMFVWRSNHIVMKWSNGCVVIQLLWGYDFALTKVWLWGNPIIALLWGNDPMFVWRSNVCVEIQCLCGDQIIVMKWFNAGQSVPISRHSQTHTRSVHLVTGTC